MDRTLIWTEPLFDAVNLDQRDAGRAFLPAHNRGVVARRQIHEQRRIPVVRRRQPGIGNPGLPGVLPPLVASTQTPAPTLTYPPALPPHSPPPAYHPTVQRMRTAIRFNVPVHFDFAQAPISGADRPLLDRFAEVVRHHYAGARVTVEGFADAAGSVKFNQALGKERAEAVRDYLVTTDSLSGDQLNTVSYGEAKNRLVAPNAKGPGEAGLQNRRVAFVIDFAADSTATTTASR